MPENCGAKFLSDVAVRHPVYNIYDIYYICKIYVRYICINDIFFILMIYFYNML